MKYVIIGGVAGGATAAARLRRLDEKCEIIVVERSSYISYANCGLPYYLGGVIPKREHLLLQNPDSFRSRYNVEVRIGQEAININSAQKTIDIKRADGTTYTESYDKLLLSPGAKPIRPNLEGIDLPSIFTLRDVDDTDKIAHYIREHNPKQALVIGAGFIGLEMIENLVSLGLQVTLVEREPQVLPHVDFPIAATLQKVLKKEGVNLSLGQSVKSFRQEDGKLIVACESGDQFPTDFAILSIGVRPETDLARTAGLKIGERGGIYVNEYLETSVRDIYAVGDAIEYPHPITHDPSMAYLAGPANRQARIAADNMVRGHHTPYEGSIVTAIIKAFDMVVATTGLSERTLRSKGINYLTSITHSGSHAGYYPGASLLSIKLNYSPETGKLLGAQCAGREGVDKRIDQLALLIKMGGTVEDLTRLEHAYAPPFSSAKDPIAIAGYVATNAVDGTMPLVTWPEWEAKRQGAPETILIDVRSREEHAHSSVEGAINIPLEELRERSSKLPKDKPIYVHCAVGLRGYLALRILKGQGFSEVYNVTGGYITYKTVRDAR